MKVEKFSADHELAMRQRAIDEGHMGRQIEMAGAYQRGKKEGREEGIARGREAERKDIALCLLAKGMSKEEIAELQGTSVEELAISVGSGKKGYFFEKVDSQAVPIGVWLSLTQNRKEILE